MRLKIYEHQYGAIGYFANDLQVAVGEDNGTGNVIFGCGHDIGQGVVALVVLARLYLYGQHMSSVLHNKVEFALPLAVKVVQAVAMGTQFLCGKVLKMAVRPVTLGSGICLDNLIMLILDLSIV